MRCCKQGENKEAHECTYMGTCAFSYFHIRAIALSTFVPPARGKTPFDKRIPRAPHSFHPFLPIVLPFFFVTNFAFVL